MDVSLHVNASSKSVLSKELEVNVNNMSNLNTDGYRGSKGTFSELVSGPGGVSYVQNMGTFISQKQGAIQNTGRKLDVSIMEGEGYFAVDTPGGVRYTRSGHFQRNNDGTLVTVDGHPVLSSDLGNITIQGDVNRAVFLEDGSIIDALGNEIGKLGVFRCDDPVYLNPAGHGLLSSDLNLEYDASIRISQGSIEGSNVNSVEGFTDMISTSRNFEASQRVFANGVKILMDALNTASN